MKDFYSKSFQLYFEYGSNMHPDQIKARCSTPEVFAIARLPDHVLSFFGYSRIWDGGEEAVVSHDGADVWGVIYKLSFADANKLDAWQDVRLDGSGASFLYPTEVVDTSGRSLPVLMIKKNILGPVETPTTEYLNHIVTGAQSQGLPPAYIENLAKTASKPASFLVPKKSKFDRSILANLSCDCGAIPIPQGANHA